MRGDLAPAVGEQFLGLLEPFHVVAEARVRRHREQHAGDTVVVRSAVLEVRDKVIRFVHQMFNAASGELCAVTQLVGAHLDTERRKTTPRPEEVRHRALQRQAALALPWDA